MCQTEEEELMMTLPSRDEVSMHKIDFNEYQPPDSTCYGILAVSGVAVLAKCIENFVLQTSPQDVQVEPASAEIRLQV